MPNVPVDPLNSTSVPGHPAINTYVVENVVPSLYLQVHYNFDVTNYSCSFSTMFEYLSYIYHNSLNLYYIFVLSIIKIKIYQAKRQFIYMKN